MTTGAGQWHLHGTNLQGRRRGAFLTQGELAKEARVSIQRIKQLELAEASSIRPRTARALAKALGCPVEDLIEVTEASA